MDLPSLREKSSDVSPTRTAELPEPHGRLEAEHLGEECRRRYGVSRGDDRVLQSNGHLFDKRAARRFGSGET
jgi:hypothetical protein